MIDLTVSQSRQQLTRVEDHVIPSDGTARTLSLAGRDSIA